MAAVVCFLVVVIVVMFGNTSAAETPCQKELREHTAASNQNPPKVGGRKPVCDSEGNYAPKQCSGSQCYCVLKDGGMIEGSSVNVWQAQDQTCKCARDKAEYQSPRIIGKMFSCLENGNYHPVQCTGSVCYCADENGKQTGTETAHISNLNTLQC